MWGQDGGGSITKEELGELMETLGIFTTPEELDLMINEIDQDNNGEIDFDGIIISMQSKGAVHLMPDRICGRHVSQSQCFLHIGASQECIQGNEMVWC